MKFVTYFGANMNEFDLNHIPKSLVSCYSVIDSWLTMDKQLLVYSASILHNWDLDCGRLDTNPETCQHYMIAIEDSHEDGIIQDWG